MKLYISNAFSLSMLDREAQESWMRRTRIPKPVDDPRQLMEHWESHGVEVESVIGHADTARLFSNILDRYLAPNRVSIKLADDETLLVGQYIGARLPEGATELPEGARIEWWTI